MPRDTCAGLSALASDVCRCDDACSLVTRMERLGGCAVAAGAVDVVANVDVAVDVTGVVVTVVDAAAVVAVAVVVVLLPPVPYVCS